MRKLLITFWCIVLILSIAPPVHAQDASQGAIYVVQEGDTLSTISDRFNVSINDLIQANNISDPNAITVGMELSIPGIEGVKGKLTTTTVPLGESLNNISITYQIPLDLLIKINHITSPAEIFAGSNLIIPVGDSKTDLSPQSVVGPGISLLESAVLSNQNPWAIIKNNGWSNSWQIVSGDTLYAKGGGKRKEVNGISPLINSIKIQPLPLSQGKTVVINISTNNPASISGSIGSNPLNFFLQKENDYVAISAIDALAEPGVIPFNIKGSTKDGQSFDYEQSILLTPGQFSQDPPLEVDPATLKADVMQAEDAQMVTLTQKASPQKLWSGKFRYPIDEPCIRSWFGNRRSYNGGVYKTYHGGLDFGVCANNLNIYAPAAGKVVFTGELNIRGKTTIIDHGWGVYTGYFHQSEIMVNVGDQVEPGHVIGQIGKTGRVTGPHLHFEVRVNGIPVNPMDWLENQYPG